MKNTLCFLLLAVLSVRSQSQAVLYTANFGTVNTLGGVLQAGWTAGGAASNNLSLSTAAVSSAYFTPIIASGGANLADAGTVPGLSTATLSGMVNTTGYNAIRIMFGWRGTATYTGAVTLEWSNDGLVWNAIVIGTPLLDGNWYLANNTWINLPAAADNQPNLQFRFGFNRLTGVGNFRIDDFTVQGILASGTTQPTDYFRSRTSGNWGIADTWESSPDQISWTTASLVPTDAANTINIRATHQVVINEPTTADQLIISFGGSLIQNPGIQFVLNDGVGADMSIFGAYTINGLMPSGTTSTIRVEPNAAVYALTNAAGESDDFAYSTRVFFGDAALFYWSAGTFQTNNITYFPNSGATDKPKFIISANVGAIGAGGTTTINGYLDVRANITFQNAGVKIFRDGILTAAPGTLIQTANCGQFVLNGLFPNIGGSGTITLGAAGLIIPLGIQAGLIANQIINNAAVTINGELFTYEYQVIGSTSLNLAGTLYTQHEKGISTTGTLAITGAISLGAASTIVYDRLTTMLTDQQFTARTDYANVQITGGSKKVLNGPVTMSGQLFLNNGLVVTTAVNLLTITATGTAVNGQLNSFVTGPLKKIGTTAFSFPVGKLVATTPHYRAISIGASLTSNEMIAEFRRENARLLGPITAAGPPPLLRISQCEYWTLDRVNGSAAVNVTIGWDAQSPCNTTYVSTLTGLVAAHFDGSSWDSYGFDGGITGNTIAGTVTWNNVNSFGPFVLGTFNVAGSPLPNQDIHFTATNHSNEILLDWQIDPSELLKEFVVERSRDGVHYEPIALKKVENSISMNRFSVSDQHPLNGLNYYRIQIVDQQGGLKFSPIVKIWRGQEPEIRFGPNPAREKIVMFLSDPRSISGIELVNITGQVLFNFKPVQSQTEINISQLQAGFYYLRIQGRYGLMIKAFVKY